jgi:transcriptional regulator with XRE-family HTH domain
MTSRQRWGTLIRSGRTGSLFLTQTEFAALVTDLARHQGIDLTVDQSTISRWEKGECAPSLRARPFIAAALEVPVDVIFQDAA